MPRDAASMPGRAFARAIALAILVVPVLAWAQVRVDDPWVRGTVGGQRVTGAFMRLVSPSDATLVDATSPVAGTIEIHETTMEGGVARMRAMPRVSLAANQPLELKPGGVHLMMMALKRPVAAGDRVPITLVFEDRSGRRSSVEVSADVRALGAAGGKHSH